MLESIHMGADYFLTVRGAFDGALAPGVFADISAALDAGAERLTVDLTDAREIDDGALAVLAAVAVRALGRGGHMFVALAGDQIMEITDPSLVRSVFDR